MDSWAVFYRCRMCGRQYSEVREDASPTIMFRDLAGSVQRHDCGDTTGVADFIGFKKLEEEDGAQDD